MNSKEKIAALRSKFQVLGINGLIVPRTDEYQNEFVPECAERLAWLTGFTGSAGQAIILEKTAAVFSDGRYTIQLRQQLDPEIFEAGDSTRVTIADWLSATAQENSVIGYDPKLYTHKQLQAIATKLADKKISLKALENNPIDLIWTDRPPEPLVPVEIFPEKYAGRSSADKRMAIAQFIKDLGCKAVILTLPDSIAWILNIRGRDVAHNPVALSYAILHDDGKLDWFIAGEKLSPEILRSVGNTVHVFEAAALENQIAQLSDDDARPVMIDTQRSSDYFLNLLRKYKIAAVDGKDPCIIPKAVKTPAEQDAMRAAHIRDGAAVTKFLYWLSENAKGQTEISIAEKLEKFRRDDPLYRDSSFETICGWARNGAIVHYRAEPGTAGQINGNGLLLIDSGAQYGDGTTDITRTVCVGTPIAEMKDRFTRVLKGHIALATARFPQGTTGAQLDSLARQSLWQAGLDYAHGTGHGVGCYLSVHEEAASISPRGNDAVLPGMILSNEPGYYKENAYGIRIENLILCQQEATAEDGRPLLYFETLTLAPIDMSLVDVGLLNDFERDWLEKYHQKVRDVIGPMLNSDEREWLENLINE